MDDAINVAKGIYEYGFSTMTLAFYLVVTGTMLFIVVRFFSRFLYKTMGIQQEVMNQLIINSDEQKNILMAIKESVNSNISSQNEIIANYMFKMDLHTIVREIHRIKEMNHIDDKEAVFLNLRQFLSNTFNKSKLNLALFAHDGTKLSNYMDETWLEITVQKCLEELYSKNYCIESCYRNLGIVMEDFKIDFFNKIGHGNN